MSTLISYGEEVHSVFQLIGVLENDITKSISWALCNCPEFTRRIVKDLLGVDIGIEDVSIYFQKYDNEKGITDIEITDNYNFYLIIEAKLGWQLPFESQLRLYSEREDFRRNPAKKKAIVSMSECSEIYANSYLPLKEVNGIPILHLSWQRIYDIACESRADSRNAEKLLLEQLKEYLGGIMTMQAKDSNWVYVVSLGTGKPDGCDLTWIDIVATHNEYFHPIGGGKSGWPKTPPNYIAFRYYGQLQSIHHIDDYVVTRNMHDEIPEMPDEEWDSDHFIYKLGPAIKPDHVVKTGGLYASGRVWAMLDTLLTADTIKEASEISKNR